MSSLQKNARNTNSTPLFNRDMAGIKRQIALWDETYGPGKVTQWLFDATLPRLRKTHGYIYTNDLLTKARTALKRAEGSQSLSRFRRLKRQAKAETQFKAKESQQPSSAEVANDC